MNAQPSITVTTLDHERLRQIIDRSFMAGPDAITPAIALLLQSLMKARVVAPTEVSRQVATINSHVVYGVRGADNHTRTLSATLVHPADADVQFGRVSVLDSTGSALLGLEEGKSIDWPDEIGQMTQYTLLKVVFQPEAVGRFDL